MNCKQGDLAIIVESYAGNEGKIVRCVRYQGRILYAIPGVGELELDEWEIDVELPNLYGQMVRKTPDRFLRPLRCDLLNDEITTSKELEAA